MNEKTIQKIKYEKMLREKQDAYGQKKARADSKRQFDARVRNAAKKYIDSLNDLLENLPEDQLDQIFEKENTIRLMKNLLSLQGDDIEARRRRAVLVWNVILGKTRDFQYITDLVGKDTIRTMRKTEHFNQNLRYLYAAFW